MQVSAKILIPFNCLAAFLLLTTCVENFELPGGSYTDLLVVEGFVTNDGGSFVKLSRTIRLDTTANNPERNAEVVITDEDGSRFVLTEDAETPGTYRYSGSDLTPVVDRRYQLEVSTRSNETIRSLPVNMRRTPDIDSVFWKRTDLPVVGGTEAGVDIMVTTHDPSGATRYYKWSWLETWQFTSAYRSDWIYNNGEVDYRTEDIFNCWKKGHSSNIIIGSSINLAEDVISNFPLHFVSAEASERLRIKYSILVTQSSLSEDSYGYWESMKKVNESVGTLFDPLPGQVYGNLINVRDPQKPVLGYFDCATTVEQRLFISRYDIADINPPSNTPYCSLDTIFLADIAEWDGWGYLLIDEVVNDFGDILGYRMSTPLCTDCRVKGTNIKPDFWE